MKRLCFLSPDIEHARQVVADLRRNGIPEKHIYALARHGTDMEDLPDAGPEDNDFLPAYKRGLELGGAAGLLAGLTALSFPPAGLVVGGGLVLLLGLGGAGVGGLMTGLAGASFPSSRLKGFETDIQRGRILIMVDLPKSDLAFFERLIRERDPDVSVEGIEPPATVIP
jgi:hypothetical protein